MEQQLQSREATSLAFRRLKISYSTRCNAICDHCSVYGGPDQRGALDRSMVLTCIQEAADFGMQKIEFTGGEICLFFKDLLEFMSCAHDCGLEVVLDTNAFWASTHERALKRLEKLKQYGLKQLVLSTDRYHQDFIPLSRIINALNAARELDITTGVTICYLQGDPTVLESVAALRPHTSNLYFQGVGPFGRGATLPRERMVKYSYSRATQPCPALYNPAVGPDGRVTLCCAPPLYMPTELARVSPLILGWLQCEPLTEILQRAQNDRFLNLLAAEGMGGVIERINKLEPDLYRPRSGGYFGMCNVCIEVLGSEPLLNRVCALTPEVIAMTPAPS